jgi:hypothetical protein
VLSDGGGCGDVAAGCPAVVVVVGVVGGVVVGGAGGGGDGVVVLAGAAGAVRRGGRGFGASTVTCGIGSAGGIAGSACGVSGAGGEGCGAGVSGAGVGAGGVSGVVVVAGGLSGGVAGVCDDATPARQSSTSAELLSRSARLLWIDITRPTSLTGTTRQPRRSTHPAKPRRMGNRPGARWRESAPRPQSMSGDGRCARAEQRGVGCRQIKVGGKLEPQPAENGG